MNGIFTLLAITLLAPFVGGLLAGMLRGRWTRIFAVLASGVTLIVAVDAVISIYANSQVLPVTYEISGTSLPWLSKAPMFGLSLDALSAVMLLGITIIGFLVVVYSTGYISPRHAEHPSSNGQQRYFFWLLFFIGSMAGIVLSPNLLQMFIFWEMTTLSSWALISHSQEEKALPAGFKALVITHIGGFAFLVTLWLCFVFTGSFSFEALGELAGPVKGASFMLLLVAAWAKSAQIPFHTWLPDAMEAPTPISAYLHAAAMVKAGVYLIARLIFSGFQVPLGLGAVMLIMALLTMFMAVLAYFRQDDLKRILAFSTIVHLGYIFVGLSLGVFGSTTGYQGAVLHILCHGAAKATLFLCVGAISYAAGTRSMGRLQGLATRLPLVGVAYLVGALAATGVPPLSAFWSKLYIFVGALQSPAGGLLLVLLSVESVISFGWLLYVGQRVFLGKPSEAASAAGKLPLSISLVLVIAMVLCLVMPLIGIPLVSGMMR